MKLISSPLIRCHGNHLDLTVFKCIHCIQCISERYLYAERIRIYQGKTMKISVLVPKGKNVDKERAFLRSEIAEAKSIKSSTNRDSVTRGL